MKFRNKILITSTLCLGLVSLAFSVLASSQNASINISATVPGVTPGICGNGVQEFGEQCDASGSNGTCPATCSDTCQLNTCAPVCGNSIQESGEACDAGSSNGVCPATCSSSCQLNSCGGGGGGGSVCGNGVKETGEACDAGSSNGSCPATCSSSCQLNSCTACGNGVQELGEECDGGSSNGTCPSGCSDSCQVNSCSLRIINNDVNVGCGSATVYWKTQYWSGNSVSSDASVGGSVGYGIKNDQENKIDGPKTVDHAIVLNNLSLGQKYLYSIQSSEGNYLASKTGLSFTSSCNVSNAGLNVEAQGKGAELDISYPQGETISRLVIRKKAGSVATSITDGDQVYDGSPKNSHFDSVNVLKDILYYYTVFICNDNNVCSSGVSGSMSRTISEASEGTASVGSKQISLSWTNPDNDGTHDFTFAAARLTKITGTCASAKPTDGTLLKEGNVSSYTDTGLTNGQQYNYKIFVKNSYGEYSDGVCLSATPVAEAESRCLSSINGTAGDGTASLSWANPDNEDGVFLLNYIKAQRSSGPITNITQGSTSYNGTGQGFTDTGLTNGQDYYYTFFVNYNDDQLINCGSTVVQPVAPVVPTTTPTTTPPVVTTTTPPFTNQPDQTTIGNGLASSTGANPKFNFYTNNGSLRIEPDSVDNLSLLVGKDLSVEVTKDNLTKDVSLLMAEFNGSNFLISQDLTGQKYQVKISPVQNPGIYYLNLSTVYKDGSTAKEVVPVRVFPLGFVAADPEGVKRLPDATITLYQDGQEVTGFGIDHQITGDNGLYGLMAPNGIYDLKISRPGYKDYFYKNFKVSNNVINLNVNLDRPLDVINSVEESLIDYQKTTQKAIAVLQSPESKAVTVNAVAPSIVTVATVNAMVAIPWWNLIYYLQSLFTEPLAWLFRKKRKGWGTVYDSITKQPVDLAAVRLLDADTKKVLQTRITDGSGRYNFLIGRGRYLLEVNKVGYDFPSSVLSHVHEDKMYVDLYHGQAIESAREDDGLIVANIPLDRKEVTITDQQAIKKAFRRHFQERLSILGPIISLISYILFPGWLTGILLVAHILLYLLFRRLAIGKMPKSWGVVYKYKTKHPLSNAVVRIFSPEYDRMLDVQVADAHGRYGFLAGNNTYYLTGSKDGYQEYKTDVFDLSKTKEEVVGKDLPLIPADEAIDEKIIESNLENSVDETDNNQEEKINQNKEEIEKSNWDGKEDLFG